MGRRPVDVGEPAAASVAPKDRRIRVDVDLRRLVANVSGGCDEVDGPIVIEIAERDAPARQGCGSAARLDSMV